MKSDAIANRTSAEPTIHRMKIYVVGVDRRLRGTAICITPLGISTETSRSRGSKSPSIWNGMPTRSAMAAASCSATWPPVVSFIPDGKVSPER